MDTTADITVDAVEAPEAMETIEELKAPEDPWADIPEEVKSLSTDEILTRIRLLDNDIKVGLRSN